MKRLIPFTIVWCLVLASPLFAQLDGTRVYWPLPKNMNVLGVHHLAGIVDATWVNFHQIEPNLEIENDLYLLTYTRSQPTLGRTVWYTAALPVGVIKTDSSLPLPSNDPFVHGVGDPSLAVTFNVFGAPGLMLREYVRYDLRTVVSLGMNATFPVGQYDSSEPLNIGSNQFKFRLSLPTVQAIGPWVPGDRTTIEVTPSLTLISDNDDARGTTIEQDPLVAVETHVTRDLTRHAFVSLDYSYIRIGESTSRDNTSGATLSTRKATDAHLLGGTASFQINDNLNLFLTHLQTVAPESGPVVLEGALSRVTLTWSWHRVIERRRALGD